MAYRRSYGGYSLKGSEMHDSYPNRVYGRGGRLAKGVRHCAEEEMMPSGKKRCVRYMDGPRRSHPMSGGVRRRRPSMGSAMSGGVRRKKPMGSAMSGGVRRRKPMGSAVSGGIRRRNPMGSSRSSAVRRKKPMGSAMSGGYRRSKMLGAGEYRSCVQSVSVRNRKGKEIKRCKKYERHAILDDEGNRKYVGSVANKGAPKKNNWILFVKAFAKEYNIGYNQAIVDAKLFYNKFRPYKDVIAELPLEYQSPYEKRHGIVA